MHRSFRFTLIALLVGFGVAPARAADKVRLENLLPQMTDLSLLCEYPDPPYVTKQFSSYDRASEHPGVESWFANGDRGFMLYDGVINTDVPFFHRHPVPGLPEDGRFTKGTRVGFSPTHKPVDGYVWAYATTADGRAGRQDSAGLRRAVRDRDGSPRARPGRDGRARLRRANLVRESAATPAKFASISTGPSSR